MGLQLPNWRRAKACSVLSSMLRLFWGAGQHSRRFSPPIGHRPAFVRASSHGYNDTEGLEAEESRGALADEQVSALGHRPPATVRPACGWAATMQIKLPPTAPATEPREAVAVRAQLPFFLPTSLEDTVVPTASCNAPASAHCCM